MIGNEAQLRRSDFYVSEGQRNSVAGTFSWQLDTAELIFSEQLHRIFEFEPNTDPTFAMIAERVYPDDIPVLADVHARVRASFDNQECEIRLQMPDGRLKWIKLFARVNRHDDGQQECVGAVLDVTQRRLAVQSRENRDPNLHMSAGLSVSER
jgi:PAS domain-containing protein